MAIIHYNAVIVPESHFAFCYLPSYSCKRLVNIYRICVHVYKIYTTGASLTAVHCMLWLSQAMKKTAFKGD